MTRPVVTLEGAGIDPTGTTSSTVGIRTLLDRHAGARFVAPDDATFLLGSPLVLSSLGNVLELGTATLQAASGIAAVSVRASQNVIEGGTIRGAQFASYSDGERGIEIVGTSSARPILGVLIQDTVVNTFGGYGIHLRHTRGFVFNDVEVTDCYYGGIFGLSVFDGYLGRPVVRRISANGILNANAYGIAWSSADESGDLVTSPMSQNIITQSPVVTDCTTWHALDTHGGDRIEFLDIDVRRCGFPVALNPGDGPDGPLVPPTNFVVTGTIDSERDDEIANRTGIIVAGAFNGTGTVDDSLLATGRIDVLVRGHGGPSSDGAMAAQASKNLDITLRSDRCSPIALHLIRDNYDFTCAVEATDTMSWSGASTYAIFMGDRNTGTITREIDDTSGAIRAKSLNTHGIHVAGTGTAVRIERQRSRTKRPLTVVAPATADVADGVR